jgi:molecular chaperone HtpG
VNRTFQVDLRGVVDLLSHHLYASPRVYLRELMQNAVDAVTARRTVTGDAASGIKIGTGRQKVTVTDPGIGLTEPQVHELLATIEAALAALPAALAGPRQQLAELLDRIRR